MSKYEVLSRLDNYQYIYNCPVFITGGNILKDTITNEIYINLKFRSISAKNIKAVIISVECYDIEKDKLEPVNKFIYQDFNISQGDFFGENETILCPDCNTRICEIKIKKVIFFNDERWENSEECQLSSLGLQTRISDWPMTNLKKILYDELKQINYSKNNAIYLPSKFNDGWICTCGMVNFDTPSCLCGMRSVNLFKIFNEKYLEEQLSAFEEKVRKKSEEDAKRRKAFREQEEKELEEKRKVEEVRMKLIEEEQQREHSKKIKTLVICALILIMILSPFAFIVLHDWNDENQETVFFDADNSTYIVDIPENTSMTANEIALSSYSLGIEDGARLYTLEQLEKLEKKQLETSLATGWNIAVVTTDAGFGTDGKAAVEFAENYYDEAFGAESSSIVYLIDTDYRHISMDGDVLNYFNTERLDNMITACEEKYMSHDDVGNLEQFYYYLEYYYNEGTVPYDSNIGAKFDLN